MILPRLRSNLEFMPSPVADRPGLLVRDFFRYSDTALIIPPRLIQGLACFDGTGTDLDLQMELTRMSGDLEGSRAGGYLIEALSKAGFLEDETYASLKQRRHLAFTESPVRKAAYAGSAYPAEIGPLREVTQRYLQGAVSSRHGVMGISAPHISPQCGWQCYRAAYQELTPDLRDYTFVVLGTSHYGQPGKFGLTRKPFETPWGKTAIDDTLVSELEAQPAAVVEDYCHVVEHSIEFQVLFLQAIYGPHVRILPILCGSFGKSIHQGGVPEDGEDVKRFLGALGEIAARDEKRLLWVLGVDMAHMGARFGDNFAAHADRDRMTAVRERDNLRIERINAGDAQGFWELVKEKEDDLKWCGSSPIYTFMKAVPQARGTLHRYEQWNVDERSVVTFAGISFAERSADATRSRQTNA
jgi:AmmeMemoRadiSam system protein B